MVELRPVRAVFHLRTAFPSPNPLCINTIICAISLADASRGRASEGQMGQVPPALVHQPEAVSVYGLFLIIW
jgi:hypothetical protein